jgi:hypothetical protein
MLNAGCWFLDAGFWFLGAGYFLLVALRRAMISYWRDGEGKVKISNNRSEKYGLLLAQECLLHTTELLTGL